jgi:hypothetical protein
VLAGTVKATEAHAVSESFRTDGGFDSSGAGSTMTGLEVLGVPFEGTPDPNTQIQLPGLGYVVLNEQIKSVTNGKASLTVNMVHVVITVPNPFVQVGTNIIVADAVSRTTDQIPGTVAATAYGAQANVGGKVLLGRLTQSSIGCLGGEKSNSLLGVDDPPVLRSGTQATHAVGSVSPSQSMSEATATIQDVDVAEGTVTGDMVTAQASASNDGTNVSLSDQGSGFVNIKVLGQAIGDNVPPNTMMQLPGLGTLWLHRVILTSASIEVRMIELIVTEQNPIGLDVGTNIKVAVAIASAQHSESARQ